MSSARVTTHTGKGSARPGAKLTADDVRAIRRLFAEGLRPHRIAPRYRVRVQTITRIVRFETWREV